MNGRGEDHVTFIENWLVKVFGRNFSPMFVVEQSHRVPARPPQPGEPPRLFLFILLNFKERNTILAKARTTGDARIVENTKISLYTDFSAARQLRRATWDIQCLIWNCLIRILLHGPILSEPPHTFVL